MVATGGVSFYTAVTVFTELLAVVLGGNWTVILPIAEVLVVPAFGTIVDLGTVGCPGGVHLSGIC